MQLSVLEIGRGLFRASSYRVSPNPSPAWRRSLGLITALIAAMAGGSGIASAAVVPIGVTGFNASTIVDAAASTTITGHTANATTNYNAYGVTSNNGVYTSSTNVNTVDITVNGPVHNNGVWFQNGWNGKTTGLPASGNFTSAATNTAVGGNTQFAFGYNGTASDYASNNTLYFASTSSSGTSPGLASGTLSLVTAGKYSSLAFLATGEILITDVPNHAYTTPTKFDVQLNFSTGPSTLYTQAIVTGPVGDTNATPQVPTGANLALGTIAGSLKGTSNGNSGHTDNGISSGRFFENDIALSLADQARTLVSITFTPNSLQGSTEGIYAVSGTVVVPEPASLGLLGIGALTLLRRGRARR